LTQQYSLLLELSGHWEWAVYVALFISDDRARVCIVRGLLQRHSALLSRAKLVLPDRPHWAGVPKAWIWQGEALRRERSWEWSAAVTCWIHSITDHSGSCAETQRAAALALGFLQVPAMLRHRLAGPPTLLARDGGLRAAPELEAANFACMAAPAKWLLSVLLELEAELVQTEVGQDVLSFMRGWSDSGAFTCPSARLARLCSRCTGMRRRLFGIPW
jgi:hypothetical protein